MHFLMYLTVPNCFIVVKTQNGTATGATVRRGCVISFKFFRGDREKKASFPTGG